MKILIASALLTLLPFGLAGADSRYVCNLNALSSRERAAHLELSRTLFAAVQEQRERKNGYAFRLPPTALASAAQWASFESRCCPFFTFELKLEGDGGPLWLTISGPEGIKTFIRAEFGI